VELIIKLVQYTTIYNKEMWYFRLCYAFVFTLIKTDYTFNESII